MKSKVNKRRTLFLVAALIIITACAIVRSYWPKVAQEYYLGEDDLPEESLEAFIEHTYGPDIDLTPFSPEEHD